MASDIHYHYQVPRAGGKKTILLLNARLLTHSLINVLPCGRQDGLKGVLSFLVGLDSGGDAQKHLHSALSSKQEAHWWSWPRDHVVPSAE